MDKRAAESTTLPRSSIASSSATSSSSRQSDVNNSTSSRTSTTLLLSIPIERINRHRLQESSSLGAARLSSDKMQDMVAMQAGSDDIEMQGRCTICLDHFQLDEIVHRLPCSHFYHKECIERWLLSRDTCPNCRERLKSVEDPSTSSAYTAFIAPSGSTDSGIGARNEYRFFTYDSDYDTD